MGGLDRRLWRMHGQTVGNRIKKPGRFEGGLTRRGMAVRMGLFGVSVVQLTPLRPPPAFFGVSGLSFAVYQSMLGMFLDPTIRQQIFQLFLRRDL